jgi:hypothetical protein
MSDRPLTTGEGNTRPSEEDERRSLVWLMDVRVHGGPLECGYAASVIDTLAWFEAECLRLRKQLAALRDTLHWYADERNYRGARRTGAVGSRARAVLGVEGEQALNCVFCGRGGPTVKPRGAQRLLACNRAACQHQAEQK